MEGAEVLLQGSKVDASDCSSTGQCSDAAKGKCHPGHPASRALTPSKPADTSDPTADRAGGTHRTDGGRNIGPHADRRPGSISGSSCRERIVCASWLETLKNISKMNARQAHVFDGAERAVRQ